MGVSPEGLVLVGELDPRGGEPLGLDPGRSGCRLRLILGMSRAGYLATSRVNLCHGTWDGVAAARAWRRLARSLPSGSVVVLLGSKVSAAAGFHGPPFSREVRGGLTLVRLPHPSGLCRAWNDRTNLTRARRLVSLSWGRATRA